MRLAGTPLGLARLGDEAGLFQHFEMLGHGRQAHLPAKWLGQVRDVGFAFGQPGEHGPTSGIGEGGESLAESIGH